MPGSPRKPSAMLTGPPTRAGLLDSTLSRRRNSLFEPSYTGSTEHLSVSVRAPDKVIVQEPVRLSGFPQFEVRPERGGVPALQPATTSDRIGTAPRRIVSPDEGWRSLPRVIMRPDGGARERSWSADVPDRTVTDGELAVVGCRQVKVRVGALLLSLTRCFDSPLSVDYRRFHDQGRRDRERVQGGGVLQEGERRDRRDGVRHHQGHAREGREDQALRLRQLRRPREALARRPQPPDRPGDRDQRAPRADLPPLAGPEERAEFRERRLALALTARGAGDTSPALAGALEPQSWRGSAGA